MHADTPYDPPNVHDHESGRALERVARMGTSPGAVVVAGVPDAPGVPLLQGRPLLAGQPAAYVCRGFVCDAPVTTVEALAGAVASRVPTVPVTG